MLPSASHVAELHSSDKISPTAETMGEVFRGASHAAVIPA